MDGPKKLSRHDDATSQYRSLALHSGARSDCQIDYCVLEIGLVPENIGSEGVTASKGIRARDTGNFFQMAVHIQLDTALDLAYCFVRS